MWTIPALIPVAEPLSTAPPVTVADQSAFYTYDITIDGLGFRLASDQDKPLTWQTAPYSKQQIDQASEAGEQTLSNWWMKSQASFHGGAGQLNIERTDLPPAATHVRFDTSKNCDVWTPGQITRLPDTTVLSTDTATSLVGVKSGGTDRAVYVNQTNQLMCNTVATPASVQFTGITEPVYSVTTDGVQVYAAGNTGVWRSNPATPGTATKFATYAADTTPVVQWVKSRLMLATAGGVYEVDPAMAPAALPGGDLRYQHPTPGWVWRCFTETPSGILAAGDSGGKSEVTKFDLSTAGAVPVLTAASTIVTMPAGERILSMQGLLGSFVAIGTTSGFRIATIQAFYGYLTVGPLTAPVTDTQFPVAALTTRDRFVYAAGLAGDEPGLTRLDTATQTDGAGRFAYAPDLIAPTLPPNVALTSAAVCVLPVNSRLVFSVPGVGLVMEGVGPGSLRDSWLRTSRIRYGTTEPKLFKFGRVRGNLSSAEVEVTTINPDGSTVAALMGFTTSDPGEFALPSGGSEWLQLRMKLIGSTCVLTSYGVKALPGLRRQRLIQVVVSCFDRETDRRGRQHVDIGSARRRMEALFALDAAGDEVVLQEYSLQGPVTRRVVIEQVVFKESARPTNTSDFGGEGTVTMRTVDS